MVTYRDYPARDIGVRDQDQELISKITKPLREVSVILFTNRSPDTRLQLVTRDLPQFLFVLCSFFRRFVNQMCEPIGLGQVPLTYALALVGSAVKFLMFLSQICHTTIPRGRLTL